MISLFLVLISLLSQIPMAHAASLPENIEACIILFDTNTQKIIERQGGEKCAERFPPCSTFKIPLALMGFDSGILSDVTTTFAWDGKPKMLKVWEQDQDARSWIRESVVWYSQILASRLGRERMSQYLKSLNYGNADMSGGLEAAWLSPEPDPHSTVNSSIKISAEEQLIFFRNLWSGKLPISERAIALAKEISFWEESARGYTLHGKSGSGYAGENTKRRLGWYIGRVKKGEQEIIGVVRFTDKKEPAVRMGFAGPQARDIFKARVAQLGYW